MFEMEDALDGKILKISSFTVFPEEEKNKAENLAGSAGRISKRGCKKE